MEISKELKVFIENQYKSMLSFEDRERAEKQEHRKNKETRRKGLSRELENVLNALETAKEKGWVSDDKYQIEKNKLSGNAEQKKFEYRKQDKEQIKPFGKTHYGFNGFVCLCWHLIKKETNSLDSNILRWISNFLIENNFRKQNKKPYNENDLKRIIYNHNYGKESFAKSHIESLFDQMYSVYLLVWYVFPLVNEILSLHRNNLL